MFQHDTLLEKALSFSRFDASHWLSPCALRPFQLDGHTWPTAEHYLQANLVASAALADKIRQAASGEQAHALGSPWYRRKRKDWKNLRRVLMTRALYTQTMTHPDIKDALLETGDQHIVETSLYDHYWGIARDQRGENTLGKVWMGVRDKIRADAGKTPAQSTVKEQRE